MITGQKSLKRLLDWFLCIIFRLKVVDPLLKVNSQMKMMTQNLVAKTIMMRILQNVAPQ